MLIKAKIIVLVSTIAISFSHQTIADISKWVISGSESFDYSNNNGRRSIGDDPYYFESAWSICSSTCIWTYNDPASIVGVALALGVSQASQITDASTYDMSSRTRRAQEGEFVILKNTGGYFAALKIIQVEDRTRPPDSADMLTFEYYIQTNGTSDFSSGSDSTEPLGTDGVGDNEDPVVANSFLGRAYHMTASTSPNLSEVHILNTSDSSLSFTGTLYHKSGNQLGDSNVALHEGTVAPQGRLKLFSADLEQRFSELPWTGPAVLDVVSSDQFELMIKLSRNGRVTNTNCVRTNNVHNIEGTDSPDVTYVRFINTGFSTLSDIRGTLYDDNGEPIGQSNAQFFASLAPREAIFLNRNSISNIVGQAWSGEASLVLTEEHEDLRLMNLNYVNDEIFFNFSCYEASN
jgi:hypothetical protein